jgi:ketosteroid isomerase-like protein
MSSDQAQDAADLRRLIKRYEANLCAKDIEEVLSRYASDIISFDLEAPLKHVGVEAKRKNWTAVFAAYEGPLVYEITDLAVAVSGDVAFARSLNRVRGTLKNGGKRDYRVRSTMCFRRIDGAWAMVHDQVSVPFDMKTGKGLIDLVPSQPAHGTALS